MYVECLRTHLCAACVMTVIVNVINRRPSDLSKLIEFFRTNENIHGFGTQVINVVIKDGEVTRIKSVLTQELHKFMQVTVWPNKP